MRVIVCGSRRWHDRHAIETWLAHLADLTDNLATVTIVTGFAAGADRIAHQEALKAGLLVEPHPADWQTHGKAAGPVRNERMAELGADLCVAFWDGRSAGTHDMMLRAEKHGIPVEIVHEGGR